MKIILKLVQKYILSTQIHPWNIFKHFIRFYMFLIEFTKLSQMFDFEKKYECIQSSDNHYEIGIWIWIEKVILHLDSRLLFWLQLFGLI